MWFLCSNFSSSCPNVINFYTIFLITIHVSVFNFDISPYGPLTCGKWQIWGFYALKCHLAKCYDFFFNRISTSSSNLVITMYSFWWFQSCAPLLIKNDICCPIDIFFFMNLFFTHLYFKIICFTLCFLDILTSPITIGKKWCFYMFRGINMINWRSSYYVDLKF